jgi:hypothetical protein
VSNVIFAGPSPTEEAAAGERGAPTRQRHAADDERLGVLLIPGEERRVGDPPEIALEAGEESEKREAREHEGRARSHHGRTLVRFVRCGEEVARLLGLDKIRPRTGRGRKSDEPHAPSPWL